MNTLQTGIYGFLLIVFLVSADLAAYYIGAPMDVRRPIFFLLAGVAVPYGAFVVRIFKVNPTLGQAKFTDAVKGNGAVTGEPTDSHRTDGK